MRSREFLPGLPKPESRRRRKRNGIKQSSLTHNHWAQSQKQFSGTAETWESRLREAEFKKLFDLDRHIRALTARLLRNQDCIKNELEACRRRLDLIDMTLQPFDFRFMLTSSTGKLLRPDSTVPQHVEKAELANTAEAGPIATECQMSHPTPLIS